MRSERVGDAKPDVIIQDPSGSVIIYVESEAGHETGATAREYFDSLAKWLSDMLSGTRVSNASS